MKKIRILVADDHAIVRTGLSSLLGTQKDFTVVGEADDGETVVAMSRELNPDVIIIKNKNTVCTVKKVSSS